MPDPQMTTPHLEMRWQPVTGADGREHMEERWVEVAEPTTSAVHSTAA